MITDSPSGTAENCVKDGIFLSLLACLALIRGLKSLLMFQSCEIIRQGFAHRVIYAQNT